MSDPSLDTLAAEKQRLLAETRADLLKRQLSNTENYDKAILSLSTAFLGFSFAFLKDVIPGQQPEHVHVLYASWIALGLAVVATIISFWLSERGIEIQLRNAEDYYLKDIQQALRKSLEAKATVCANYMAGALFILGLALTTYFVIANFQQRSVHMSHDGNKSGGPTSLREGATIPSLQKVEPLTKGATIPNLQQVQKPAAAQQPQSQPAQTPSSPASGGQESVGKK